MLSMQTRKYIVIKIHTIKSICKQKNTIHEGGARSAIMMHCTNIHTHKYTPNPNYLSISKKLLFQKERSFHVLISNCKAESDWLYYESATNRILYMKLYWDWKSTVKVLLRIDFFSSADWKFKIQNKYHNCCPLSFRRCWHIDKIAFSR